MVGESTTLTRISKSVSFSNINYSVLVNDEANGKTLKPILRDVTGSLKGGEMMCILGPSGSGKTSLVQIIAGGIKSTRSGTHVVAGSILSSLSLFVDIFIATILIVKSFCKFSNF